MILAISSSEDEHARAVLQQIAIRGGNARLMDLSEYPQKAEVSICYDQEENCFSYRNLGTNSPELDLRDCRVIWWRRPQPFELHTELMDTQDRSFAYSEIYSTFSGLWLALDTHWINHPTRDEEAARKVYQLRVARETGFRIPDTCITSSPDDAREFIRQQGENGTIYKAFTGTRESWRETRLLRSDEARLIDNVKFAPVIFQEYIEADLDLRITVVGRDIFASAIYSQETEYKVDFRMTMDSAKVEAFELPDHILENLQVFMKRLGLVYGAIDMRRTTEGEYVFLEINPSGQWLFIEERTGLPITDAVVTYMLEGDI